MKRSEMLKLLKKKKKEYIGCCKEVDYGKLLSIVEKAGMKPPRTAKQFKDVDRSHVVELYGHGVVPSGYIEVYDWEKENE